ncbi:FMN-binding protein [Tersicoccus solisilvae]|uniref:FMN-binding protein n=1 Tax=Tersicoccus solisilvae TaxID=1882339 RepID=A0ABQ1NQW0_9MICC|nr:FMN-binding protein [Tersicoccus solisilvae]GGC82381.1 FMN-binding protein [Tersicoccus solisilvae]
MRRIVLWAAVTVTVLVLLFSYRTSTNALPAAAAVAPDTRSTASGGITSGGSGTSSGTSGSGTYTGDAVDTRWGPVQVRITVADGKVTAAEAVVYPQENHRDVEINAVAIPMLNQEAVDAQSADIDMVSGATVTSDGYIGSLQSALDQAHLS